jgi:glycoside/pentoside/hexuronide:cation symporter, GPH family
MSTANGWRQASTYGFMAAPLAFAALPLYVLFPQFYAAELGVSLAALGVLLLLVRALDAVTDPLIGRLLDKHLHTHNLMRFALGGTAVLVLGFWAVFSAQAQWSSHQLLLWAGVMLTLCTGAYSLLTLALQTWVSRLQASAAAAQVQRTLIAWREGFGLLGVVIGASLPAVVGLQATTAALLALVVLALAGWYWVRRQLPLQDTAASTNRHTAAQGGLVRLADAPVQRHAFFKQLMAVHVINGMASAIPATLVLFFVQDRLQAPAGSEGLFLLLYFAAAGAGMPLWQRAMARFGLVKSWGAAMLIATAAFAVTATLGEGDGMWFALVCLGSGMALGADLCIPQAMLAQWLNRPVDAAEPTARKDGQYFGWWNVVSKGNLALAAGVSLPLLGWLGYVPGTSGNTEALAWVYGALPCVLKIIAATALWHYWLKGLSHAHSHA